MCGLIRWKDYRKSLCHNDSLKRNHRSKFIAAKYTTFKTSSSAAINHGCWGIWWQRLNCCKGYCCASDSCNCHQIVCQLLTGQKSCPAFTMGGSVTAVGEAVCAMVTTSDTLPDRHLWAVIFYSVAEVLRSACRANKRGKLRDLSLTALCPHGNIACVEYFPSCFPHGVPSTCLLHVKSAHLWSWGVVNSPPSLFLSNHSV